MNLENGMPLPKKGAYVNQSYESLKQWDWSYHEPTELVYDWIIDFWVGWIPNNHWVVHE